MRQETNNEMDLLLRRLGRRQDTAASTDHLDADELSLYAENVLPPAARARYTEHLAECARCRDLVVQLSSSAGVVVAQETAKVSAPSALRKFLASLLSPMVLRYAVPALGLIVVAAIGLMVWRQQPVANNSPVAQVTQQERAQAPIPASQPEPSSSGLFGSPAENTAPANKGTAQSSDKISGPAPPPSAPVTVDSTTAQVQQEPAAKKVEPQPTPIETPAAAKTVAATDEVMRTEAQARKQKAEDQTVVANEPPPAKAPEETKKESVRAGAVAATPAARLRAAEPLSVADSSRGARDDTAEKDKNDGATRTVAGRRFRKQGGIWIDTAYNSSRSPMDLPRGSEQYRSLVADEPAIKKIADELDGEIILVWKGRPYRIQ